MGRRFALIPFAFLILSAFSFLPFLVYAQQEGGPDRILRDYFPKNEARDQAVITGRYAEAAHRFADELIQKSSSRAELRKKFLLADTARAFILHARQRVDSTLHYASDSSRMARLLIKQSRTHLLKGQKLLRTYRGAPEPERRQALAEEALETTAEASVDVFHASMLLGSASPRSPVASLRRGGKGDLYDLVSERKEQKPSQYEEEASRLQVDRKSFRTLRKRYDQDLKEKKKDIQELRDQGASSERIDSLEEEKEILALRKKDAKEQVEQIDKMLENKLLDHIGADTSKEGRSDFQVNRYGYYEDRSIPIDAEQSKGLIYRVQVGYYSEGNRPEKKLEGLYPIWGEQVSEKYLRYCVGRFRRYGEAEKAKAYLRKNGFEGAFIVAYRDGTKVPVVDAIREEEGE